MPVFTSGVSSIGEVSTGGTDLIHDSLSAIRKHLGMEVAYLSEFVNGRAVFRSVDAPGLDHLIKVGDSRCLSEVYCEHILAGRLPELISDTSLFDLSRELPITSAVPIGSHVSIPIRLPDGSPFGMFCCLSPRPMPNLNERDLATMRVFAGLAAKQVNAGLQERLRLEEIRAAITRVITERDFDIVFQPIVELRTSRVVACEALTRFRGEPYRSPDRWFEEAASVGRSVDLEMAAIEAAIATRPFLPAGIALSINASPDAILSGRLAPILDGAQAPGIIVEITEHAKVADYGSLHGALAPLREAGVKVAVDDAGAGYSGLQHIVQLGPDIIKMDMSLTRAIDSDPARRALASAMVFYARETGASVVAEGVETDAELATLKLLGADRAQGYLLGRPGRREALFGAATPTGEAGIARHAA